MLPRCGGGVIVGGATMPHPGAHALLRCAALNCASACCTINFDAALPLRARQVADFGLAINIVKERPVSRVGTLDYMPPEVGWLVVGLWLVSCLLVVWLVGSFVAGLLVCLLRQSCLWAQAFVSPRELWAATQRAAREALAAAQRAPASHKQVMNPTLILPTPKAAQMTPHTALARLSLPADCAPAAALPAALPAGGRAAAILRGGGAARRAPAQLWAASRHLVRGHSGIRAAHRRAAL